MTKSRTYALTAAGTVATVVVIVTASVGLGRLASERRMDREVDAPFASSLSGQRGAEPRRG